MIKDDMFKVHAVVLKSNMKAVLSSVNLALATCFGHMGTVFQYLQIRASVRTYSTFWYSSAKIHEVPTFLNTQYECNSPNYDSNMI